LALLTMHGKCKLFHGLISYGRKTGADYRALAEGMER
jgi:hypothetical protein